MKIVYFIDHLRPEGAQLMLRQLTIGLSIRGHRQVVICLNDSFDSQVMENIEANGIPVKVIGKMALISGSGLWQVFRFLKTEAFDVAVTTLFAADLLGRPLAKWAGIPKVVTAVQARNEFYSPLQRFLVAQTARYCDLAVLCSRHIRKFALQNEGYTSEMLIVIPNSIRTRDYDPSPPPGDYRESLGIATGRMLLGTVGRLTHQKGFDILLNSLARLDGMDFHLIIAGEGEEETGLKEQASRLGLSEKVSFLGFRRDIPDLLREFDIYVQPSRYEGMPFAVLEAMACGRPVVASEVDGIRELIRDGIEGWLSDPEEPVSLAQSLAEALGQPEEATRRGAAARKRAEECFDEPVITARWEGVFKGLAGAQSQILEAR